MAIDAIYEEREAKNLNRGIAYFYFKYENREFEDEETVVRALLKQLVYQAGHMCPELETLPEASGSGKPPTLAAFRDVLSFYMKRFSSFFVILDGIDRCSDTNKREIFQLIDRFLRWQVKTIVFCQSQLKERFTKLGGFDTLEITSHRTDLKLYVQQTLKLQKVNLKDDSVKQLIGTEDEPYSLFKGWA
jgi:hypothetical protein